MKTFIVASLIIFTITGCYKEYSFEGLKTVVLPDALADTLYINDTTDFYDIQLDGQRQVHVLGHHNLGAWSGASGDSVGSILHYFFYPDALTDFEFYKGTLTRNPSDSTFLLMNERVIRSLLPGTFPYTADPQTLNGVYFNMTDSAGVAWSTTFGIADQTNGYFQIIKQINRDDTYATTGISHAMHIVCRFECVLYDGKGNSKKIKNGKMGVTLWI